MEVYKNYKPFTQNLEKDSAEIFLQSPADQINIKSLSFLRQSANSMENYFIQPYKDPNLYISDKNGSIPEIKDLTQERTLSRLKSRASSNSKSPKNNLNFNGNVQNNFLKDLENQWKNMKEDHQNFISKNGNKSSFISNHNNRDDANISQNINMSQNVSQNKQDRSVSPSKILNFNQNFEENNKYESNKFYQNSDKKAQNLLTPNKFLKRSVPHSKINLELCKKILNNNNPQTNSERNTPEKHYAKDKGIEKREYSPGPSNLQNNPKDNQQHFKLILNKYANIYKKNIEIDLTNIQNSKSIIPKNISKISSEDDKKSLNNSKISTNTGKSENIKKNGGLLEKLQENKLKIAVSQNSIKNLEFEKNSNANLNDKINEKLRKINTTKIYLKDDDASMDIPSENKDLDLAKKTLTQSPQYFTKKHSFGSSNLNSENVLSKNDKFNKSFIESTKKTSMSIKERESLKSNQTNKAVIQSYTPKKEATNKTQILNEKAKPKEVMNKFQAELPIDKNIIETIDRKNKNIKEFPPCHHILNHEKENLDLEKLQSSYHNSNNIIHNSNHYLESFSNSLENKKIIESLYKNCIEEKTIDNINRNSYNNKNEEKDSNKKLNLTSEDSKFSSFVFSQPNAESVVGFPFVENNDKVSYSMKNFNKPNHLLDIKPSFEEEKKYKSPQNYDCIRNERTFEIPKKNTDYLFSFNSREEKGYSLLNEKILTSDKHYNLK